RRIARFHFMQGGGELVERSRFFGFVPGSQFHRASGEAPRLAESAIVGLGIGVFREKHVVRFASPPSYLPFHFLTVAAEKRERIDVLVNDWSIQPARLCRFQNSLCLVQTVEGAGGGYRVGDIDGGFWIQLKCRIGLRSRFLVLSQITVHSSQLFPRG